MQETVCIVIIAKSVVRTSIVYNCSKLVCGDTLMFERSELGSDRIWHAVSGIHTISRDPKVAKLKQYNVELCREIRKFAGQNIGLHMTVGIMLPITEERFDLLKSTLANGKSAAQSFVLEYTANDDNNWSTELITTTLTTRCQKFALFDAHSSRTRK